MKWLYKNRVFLILLPILWIAGYGMGWFSKQKQLHSVTPYKQKKEKKKITWTCSMHPQIQLPKFGKCPICVMDLIPLESSGTGSNPRELELSEAGKKLAEIQTSLVHYRPLFLKVRMVGRIIYDETRVKSITTWIPGRLERLFVDYTGIPVRKGDHLVRIYSPELFSAQEELLIASKSYQKALKSKRKGIVFETTLSAFRSAKRKLELLGLRSWQVKRILHRKVASVRLNIYAPMGGIVIDKKVMEGMYVKTGSQIYTIADLSQVWVRFDAYERDLPWLHIGQKVHFTTQSTPGREFAGKVAYIDPTLDPKTRTVSIRINAKNKKSLLKPGMFVQGHVFVMVNANGYAQAPRRKGRWTCPMHPEITRKKRTICPICGMRLERLKNQRSKGKDPLVIPASAPLITGKRALVYVEKPSTKKPTYIGRNVVLGPKADGYYVVLKGLKSGERVVTKGAFRLDSELQLQARPSMMNPKDEQKVSESKLKRIIASKTFLKKLTVLYHAYFMLQKALADDAKGRSQKAYATLFRLLKARYLLPRKQWIIWEKKRGELFDLTNQGRKQSNLKTQRVLFKNISKIFISLEQQFGHSGMNSVYRAYCPMAFNNKGADWLQQTKKIMNPFFGSEMLHCGSLTKSFVGKDAEPVQASKKFLSKLSPIYSAYLKMQHGLFKDRYKDSIQAAKKLNDMVSFLKRSSVPKAFRKRWKVLSKELFKHTSLIIKSKEIEEARKHFEGSSKMILQLVYIFGHVQKTSLYEAFCPMAFNNRGAAWLQDQDKQVHNSYFGAKMAFCGSIRRKFSTKK